MVNPAVIPPYAHQFMPPRCHVNCGHGAGLFSFILDIIAYLRSFATGVWHSFLCSAD